MLKMKQMGGKPFQFTVRLSRNIEQSHTVSMVYCAATHLITDIGYVLRVSVKHGHINYIDRKMHFLPKSTMY